MTDIPAIFAALARHQVRYVLVGGLGAVAHGARIPSADVDICIATDLDNLRRVALMLKEMHARFIHHPQRDPDFDDWQGLRLDSPATHHLFSTRYGDIDVLPQPFGPYSEHSPFTYEQLTLRAVNKRFGGLSIPVAALDDIIASKQAAGRAKDRAAWPELQRIRNDLASGIVHNGLTALAAGSSLPPEE